MRIQEIQATESGYAEVLALRRMAYVGAGKMHHSVSLNQLQCCTDSFSTHVVAYQDQALIASVTLAFAEREDQLLDTERPLPGGYPKPGVPPKSTFAELARLCVHPLHQGGDFLFHLFIRSYQVILERGRSYALTSATRHRLKFYQSLGFRSTGLTYAHPDLGGEEHTIILVGQADVNRRLRNHLEEKGIHFQNANCQR